MVAVKPLMYKAGGGGGGEREDGYNLPIKFSSTKCHRWLLFSVPVCTSFRHILTQDW